VPWSDEYGDPTCDCTQTSYVGRACDADEGLHLDGSSYLSFRLGRILETSLLPDRRLPPSLRFSFSTSTQISEESTLAQLVFSNNMKMSVLLVPNFGVGGITVRVEAPQRVTVEEAFVGNFTNGQRHFVFMKFRSEELYIKLDGLTRSLSTISTSRIDLSEAKTLLLGGNNGVGDEETKGGNYSGCISNAIIDFRDSKGKYVFSPIEYYANPDSAYGLYLSILPVGSAGRLGACGGGPLGVPTPPAPTFPPWHAPFQREPYVPPTEEEGGGGGGSMGVAIALIVILLVVVIGVGGYVYYVKCVRGKRKSHDVSRTYEASDRDLDSPPPDKPTRVPPPDPSSPEERVPLRTGETHPESHYYPRNGAERPSMYSSAPSTGAGMENLPTNPELPEGTENLDDRRESSQPVSP
jgi:hypothetical protein